MSFTQSFATGYQVGRDIRKRRATSKFFDKFKELTAEDEEDTAIPAEAAEGETAIPPATEAAVGEAAAVTESEKPVEPAATETALPAPGAAVTAGAAEEPPAQAAVETALPAPGAEAEEPAAPALPAATPPSATEEAAAATEAAAPPAEKAKPAAPDHKVSLTRDHIKELDRLALEAAKASGDMEVYNALRNTTDSFLQGKVLKNLGLAQAASDNGDLDATEKYLKQAYRFVPDGQEVKFERKDGKLMTQDPWGEKGEMIPMGSEQIGYIQLKLTDPKEWSKVVREGRKEKADIAARERELSTGERNAATNERRAATEEQRAKDERAQWIESHALAKTKEAREAAGQKYDNLVKMSEAARNYAEAEYARAGKGGSATGAKPDDMRQYGIAVSNEVEGFLRPQQPADPNNPLAKPGIGPPPAGFEMFVDQGGGLNSVGLQAKELGGMIGIANPEMGPAGAARAGMEITRALVDPNGPKLAVSPSRGTVTIPVGGRLVAVKVPQMVMESFVAAAEQQKNPASK